MALGIPVLEDITPFEANETYVFKFRYDSGGDQYTKNNLVISTNRGDGTDTEVYNVEVNAFDAFHTYVPVLATTPLENGKQYKVKIRVGRDTNWSAFSDWKLFYVHSTPVIDITNIYDRGFIYTHIEISSTSIIPQ